MQSDWIDILNQVKAGTITAEEGAERLQRLETSPSEPPVQEAPQPEPEGLDPEQAARLNRWRSWWLYPFMAGLAVFMAASTLMAWSFTNERFFWFACAWLPLLVGLAVLSISAWSRTARWLHVRIKDPGKDGEKPTRIAISMPVPVHLAGWALRVFGPMIPHYKEKNLDTLGPILETLGSTHEPLSVEVDDHGGEEVKVYIV